MRLPLRFTFKKLALTNKLTVVDANGEMIAYSEQKLLNIKERILLYKNSDKTEHLGEINADRVIDFSPVFSLTDAKGALRARIIRHGKQSLWTASYDVVDEKDAVQFHVKEEKAWVKFWNGMLAQVPLLGLFAGYFLNPTYLILSPAGEIIGRISKKRSLLESNYELTSEQAQPTFESLTSVLALGIVIMRERMRG